MIKFDFCTSETNESSIFNLSSISKIHNRFSLILDRNANSKLVTVLIYFIFRELKNAPQHDVICDLKRKSLIINWDRVTVRWICIYFFFCAPWKTHNYLNFACNACLLVCISHTIIFHVTWWHIFFRSRFVNVVMYM